MRDLEQRKNKMVLMVAAEEYKLLSGFEDVRKKLLSEDYADRLDKPLAYWALPNDRRLPLAFLGRSLKDLLNTPFEELSATPGIGHKKIASLVRLLHRATEELPTNGMPPVRVAAPSQNDGDGNGQAVPEFDPSTLSEGTWEAWRETVRRHRLGQEKLGRLAGSLQSLPTVIWHTPLRAYLGYSLAEMRRLKTHGEKRIRAILEVFYEVHKTLALAPSSGVLSVQLRPAFLAPIEDWLSEFLAQSPPPPDVAGAAIVERLAKPLLDQIQIDSGTTVRALAEGRLGIHGPVQTVRHQSRKMGVTRARIYQLLDDCAKVADVRWPEGKAHLAAVAAHLGQTAVADASGVSQAPQLVAGLREILFPEKYDSLEETGLS